jgi:hypothetical protein
VVGSISATAGATAPLIGEESVVGCARGVCGDLCAGAADLGLGVRG